MCRAVQANQWQEAITAYSEAINACADAPALFSAVLHSNRAAAYQGLQQYADAVADNLRARALDPSYGKVGLHKSERNAVMQPDPLLLPLASSFLLLCFFTLCPASHMT